MNSSDAGAFITVKSSTIEPGEALPKHARDSIIGISEKYFGHLNAAAVYFGREGHAYRCTANIQMGGLKMVTGEALSPDCHQAFDAALERAAKQLRRKKRELRDDKPVRVDKELTLR